MTQRRRKGIEEMFTDEDRKVYEADNVLARLFRVISRDLNVDVQHFYGLMNHWLNDPRNGIGKFPKDRSTARGNLTKEILRPNMTWDVFIKALRWLKVVRVEFCVKITRESEGRTKTTQHAIDIVDLPGHYDQIRSRHKSDDNWSDEDYEVDGPTEN